MNMIVSKRHIVLASLVLGLGVAVYLNWQYADAGKDITMTNKIEEVKNYGDAKYVDSKSEDDAYFAQAKLSRTKSRDEAVVTLKDMLQDAALETDQKTELALKAAELAKSIEVEGKIENLIKAQGFDDCMVYYDTDRLDVIVKTAGLLENETMQIWDIIAKETGLEAEKVSIVEINK